MQLHKTELARSALGERAGDISIRERRILILSDGQRSMEDIAALLGAEARASVLRLVQAGYLSASEATAPAAIMAARGPLGGLQQATNAVRLPPVEAGDALKTIPQAAPATATVATTSGTMSQAARPAARRSLAATKMYVLDMLQLQRDPDAVALKAAIQTSVGQDAILAAVIDAVAHLQQVSNGSYGRRVFERVAEIIPEAALSPLQARCQPPAEAVA